MAFPPPPVLRNRRLRLGDQTDASRCLVAAIVGTGFYFFVSGQLEVRRERKWPFGFWLLIQVILGRKSLGPICCLGHISPEIRIPVGTAVLVAILPALKAGRVWSKECALGPCFCSGGCWERVGFCPQRRGLRALEERAKEGRKQISWGRKWPGWRPQTREAVLESRGGGGRLCQGL